MSLLHAVNQRPIERDFPEGSSELVLGMGCFWGAERRFWIQPGVWVTSVGYAAGSTPQPTYQQVCSGLTGHNEVVRVIYDPAQTSLADLLKVFWESHDPTQGMRQGNDIGTQYRSGLYLWTQEELDEAIASRATYQQQLTQAGLRAITTEVLPMPEFHLAEEYHQQYLHKNPNGYCGLRGTGVSCSFDP